MICYNLSNLAISYCIFKFDYLLIIYDAWKALSLDCLYLLYLSPANRTREVTLTHPAWETGAMEWVLALQHCHKLPCLQRVKAYGALCCFRPLTLQTKSFLLNLEAVKVKDIIINDRVKMDEVGNSSTRLRLNAITVVARNSLPPKLSDLRRKKSAVAVWCEQAGFYTVVLI